MKIVQLLSHAAEMYALTDKGEIWVRTNNPKFFGNGEPRFVWHMVDLPAPPVVKEQPVV